MQGRSELHKVGPDPTSPLGTTLSQILHEGAVPATPLLLDLTPSLGTDSSPLDSVFNFYLLFRCLSTSSPLFSFDHPLSTGGLFLKGVSSHWVSPLLHVSCTLLACNEASSFFTPLKVSLQRSLSDSQSLNPEVRFSVFYLLPLKM